MWLTALLASAAGIAPSGPSSFTLDNGLRVYLDPLPGRATVGLVVGYPAGASAGPPGRHGLAHLVEHLVFRRAGRFGEFAGTTHVIRTGGIFNGVTATARTWYQADLLPEALDRALVFERERMAFSKDAITEEDLRRERAVVQRELELREGYGRRAARAILRTHLPPGSSWVGTEHERAEVGRHTLAEVRWFLERHYRPDLAVVAISGGFDGDALRRRVVELFGALSVPSDPPPDYAPPPPRRRLAGLRAKTRAKSGYARRIWLLPAFVDAGERAVLEVLLERVAGRVRRRSAEVSRRSDASVGRNGPLLDVRLEVQSFASKPIEPAHVVFDEVLGELRDDPRSLVEATLEFAKLEAELRLRRRATTPIERAGLAMHALLDGESPGVEARVAEVQAVDVERATAMLARVLEQPAAFMVRETHDGDARIEEVALDD